MRLAVIITHPIQYYAPVFKLLTERNNIQLKVFYTLGRDSHHTDPGFKQSVKWDIPLLNGYNHEFIDNTSVDPGSHHFNGIINPGLVTRVKIFKPDAVLIYGWAYNSHLKALRYFKNKIPVIFRGDSTLLDKQNPLKAFLRYLFLKWVYNHVSYALYNGTNNKAYFKKHGIRDKQLFFAPHAIDNDRFAIPRNAEADQLRRQLNIKQNDILILFAGKLEAKKDPLLLLKAFMCLKKATVHLVFVGGGELKDELIKASSSIDNVHFLDFRNQSQMPVVYQSCDLFCLPSRGPGETWGLAVNEAMACKKAILVSDKVGCAADLVKHKINGSIFKSGELKDLSDYLSELTDSSFVLQQYGNQSATLIKDWNFTEIAKSIETLLGIIQQKK